MLSASPEHLENDGPARQQPDAASRVEAGAPQNNDADANQRKNKRPRTGRRRRNRRESFAAGERQHLLAPVGGSRSGSHVRGGGGAGRARPPLPASPSRPNSNQTVSAIVGQHGIYYPLGDSVASKSTTSLDSEALLDHRDQPRMRPRGRRQSVLRRNSMDAATAISSNQPKVDASHGATQAETLQGLEEHPEEDVGRRRQSQGQFEGSTKPRFHKRHSQGLWTSSAHPESDDDSAESESTERGRPDDKTPLLRSPQKNRRQQRFKLGKGDSAPDLSSKAHGGEISSKYDSRANRPSPTTAGGGLRRGSPKSKRRSSATGFLAPYDINNPPSVASSLSQGVSMAYGIYESMTLSGSPKKTTSLGHSANNPPAGPSTPSREGPVTHGVNNPPSVPSSPAYDIPRSYDDVMIPDDFVLDGSPERRGRLASDGGSRSASRSGRDGSQPGSRKRVSSSSPQAVRGGGMDHRKRTMTLPVHDDVCFPVDALSEMAEEDAATNGQARGGYHGRLPRRRRRKVWPELSVLEEWSLAEQEDRSDEVRAKKVSEPVFVHGRLRPLHQRAWHRSEEDAPYRFTYFNEDLPSTIHSQTISELLQPGQTFKDLFVPEPPVLSDSESDDDDDMLSSQETAVRPPRGRRRDAAYSTSTDNQRSPDQKVERPCEGAGEDKDTGQKAGPAMSAPSEHKPKRYGSRPVFWLDVMSPTDAEIRVLAKTFGIHPLTVEDIMLQEAREKVELFHNYYFVNYRTFEQDPSSSRYMDPVSLFIVVFREGVLTFHFSMVPHPANVRRRIRQLKDYIIPTSDWISYAIVDDITDAFAPLSQALEEEVDEIEDAILRLPSWSDRSNAAAANNSSSGGAQTADSKSSLLAPSKKSEGGGRVASSSASSATSRTAVGDSGSDMLRRVGDCRKKVMGLYRLLGNKADVIKGFAKRCTSPPSAWAQAAAAHAHPQPLPQPHVVTPQSEIGLYLGDIQDHIVTMTTNLSHYETILSRAHSNYLAQINLTMNERQEATADVLGKLTVLGTIVLPMNIITGLFGMNCLVPGQDEDTLRWFWGITASLVLFGTMCYFIARKVYKIV